MHIVAGRSRRLLAFGCGARRRARLGQGAGQDSHRVLPRRLADRVDHQGHRARRRARAAQGRDLRRLPRCRKPPTWARRWRAARRSNPRRIKGKAGSIPVNVQAANDGTNLYLRFSWKQPRRRRAEDGRRQPGQAGRSCSRTTRSRAPICRAAGRPATPTRAPCRTPRTTRRPSTSRTAAWPAASSTTWCSGRARAPSTTATSPTSA